MCELYANNVRDTHKHSASIVLLALMLGELNIFSDITSHSKIDFPKNLSKSNIVFTCKRNNFLDLIAKIF
jgi:hypothetical protein